MSDFRNQASAVTGMAPYAYKIEPGAYIPQDLLAEIAKATTPTKLEKLFSSMDAEGRFLYVIEAKDGSLLKYSEPSVSLNCLYPSKTTATGLDAQALVKEHLDSMFYYTESGRGPNGVVYPFGEVGARLYLCGSRAILITGKADDIDELRLFNKDLGEQGKQLNKLAKKVGQDPVTGYQNYEIFKQRLEKVEEGADKTKSEYALIMLDIDRFKEFNEFPYSTEVADNILKRVADLVNEEFSERNFGRIGDEFVIAIPHCESAKAAVARADTLRKKIEDSLVEIKTPEGIKEIKFTASLGIAYSYRDPSTKNPLPLPEVRSLAEKAMKGAKNGDQLLLSYGNSIRYVDETGSTKKLKQNKKVQSVNLGSFKTKLDPKFVINDFVDLFRGENTESLNNFSAMQEMRLAAALAQACVRVLAPIDCRENSWKPITDSDDERKAKDWPKERDFGGRDQKKICRMQTHYLNLHAEGIPATDEQQKEALDNLSIVAACLDFYGNKYMANDINCFVTQYKRKNPHLSLPYRFTYNTSVIAPFSIHHG